MRILVVEDTEMERDFLRILLRRDGHIVKTAVDGVDAMACFAKFSPDVVITDMVMPNKDGIELTRELLQKYPALPIIAMSGDSMFINNNVMNDILQHLGVKKMLLKPFSAEELKDAIRLATSPVNDSE